MPKTYVLAVATIIAALIGFAAIRWHSQPNEYTFSAVVKKPDGHSIPNARIQATLDQSIPEDTISDSEGAFHIQIPSTVHSLHLSVDAGDLYEVLERDANPHRTGLEILRLSYKKDPSVGSPTLNSDQNAFRTADSSSPPDSSEPHSPIGRAMIKLFSIRLPAAKGGSSAACVQDSGHPYQCLDDAVLGQKILDEVTTVRTLSMQYSDPNPSMTQRQKFTDDLQNCCWKDMLDLRYGVFDHLGASAQSRDEERAWENMALYRKSPMKTLAPEQVISYLRYFENWGNTLEQKSAGR